MSGLYQDINEDPQVWLDRLEDKRRRGAIRPSDEIMYKVGVEMAKEQIAARETKQRNEEKKVDE